MANPYVACVRVYSKPTFIYVLMDPDTSEVRYIGKTVKTLRARLATHISHAKVSSGHKRHVLAWIYGLLETGKLPVIQLVETIAPNTDWVIAEQRWVMELREAGADLCNLTDGGEGSAGYRQSAETIAKRPRRFGPANNRYGKPLPPEQLEAMLEACRKLREDPEWVVWSNAKRKAGFTLESRARANDALRKIHLEPEKLAAREINRKAAMKQPKTRALIGADSKRRWAEDRQKIIDAQNAGKGAEWLRKQSESKTAQWANPEWRARILETRRLAFINRRRKPEPT